MIRRTPLRHKGRVWERTEAVRQQFLAVLFAFGHPHPCGAEGAVATSFCGAAVGEDGLVYRHPIGTGAEVKVFQNIRGTYWTGFWNAHCHHTDSRNHGHREDMNFYVLLSKARHDQITAYEKGAGGKRRWEPGCGV